MNANTDLSLQEMLLLHIRRKYGKQSAAAAAWGVTGTFVSYVLKGQRPATKTMLDDAGIVKTVTYTWDKP